MRRFRTFSVATTVAIAAGCSIVNTFDDVTPPRETAYTTGPKVVDPLAEGGADAGADGTSGSGDEHAVLVVGGVVDVPGANELREPVLTLLDPITGNEFGVRETMHVAGIAHDAPRDLWYIFEAPTSFITTPADVVHLHIRKLDAKSGVWTELSNTVVPTLFFYEAIAPTNERLT
ncbi:MAG TPA: hypothetical protein VM580_28055, partial [Labilithrix sp.]|nr:hypothetical protein [Labilithrix sp.]